MPPQQRLGRNHERGPSIPREGPARRREERPIPLPKVRPADRASEHLHLMAEDSVLELELGDTPTSSEHRDEANEDEVKERSQGARMLPTSVNQSRIPFWSPTAEIAFVDHGRMP